MTSEKDEPVIFVEEELTACIKDEESIISAEDEPLISLADDISHEEDEESQTDSQKKAEREIFKQDIPSLDSVQPQVQHFVNLYLDYKEFVNEQPSPEEADELLIQLEIIGPGFIDSIREELRKENNPTTNSLMEKFSIDYPILPYQTLSHLIIQVLAATMNDAPPNTPTAGRRSLHVSEIDKRSEAVVKSSERSADKMKEAEEKKAFQASDAPESSAPVQLRLPCLESIGHDFIDSVQEEENVTTNSLLENFTREYPKLPYLRRPVQEEESSSEDDLIVVHCEHCTIDPITKKQITEPMRNKKCNHIYEKATIYSMIEQARENQKSVRCPYMGCNQKDFKKTDLVKDREVAKHLEEKRDEKKRYDDIMEGVFESSESNDDEMEESEDMEETDGTNEITESSEFPESSALPLRRSLPWPEEEPTSETDEADSEAEGEEEKINFAYSSSQFSAQNQFPQTQSPQIQSQVHSSPKYDLQGYFKCSLCDLVLTTEAQLKTHKKEPHRYDLSQKKFLTQNSQKSNNKEKSKHQVCHICFRQKHTKQSQCPVIVIYKANVSARMPRHVCITCLGPRTSRNHSCKRPNFCFRHAGKIKIHRDICRKCHQKKSQQVATLQRPSDISTSSKGASIKTKLKCKKLEEEIKEAMMATLLTKL